MWSAKDKQGWMLIACVGIVLLALGVGKAVLGSKPKPGLDNCVGSESANTVIVLDRSQGIATQTLNELVARAMAAIAAAQENERISIFTVTSDSRRSLEPILSLCKPPKQANRLVEDVKRVQALYQDRFERPIRKSLEQPVGESAESPIAQVLTDLSVSKFLRADRNRLLIFSDMLEHTSRFSLYKCTAQDEVVSVYRQSRAGGVERPTFRNTSVSVNYIPRRPRTDISLSRETLRCRERLWTWFFGDNSGPDAGLTTDYLPGEP